ncbi:MAG: hypothetical protein OEQ39_20955 [Gammaproteobacteria bacterium]|nr:hypothetical protein [Gammaproteobacteria bacterium]MDH3468825.1 hypothetical protein [Gammaproteobacteria bacterium]
MRPYTAAILTVLLINIASAQPTELMRAYILDEVSHHVNQEILRQR